MDIGKVLLLLLFTLSAAGQSVIVTNPYRFSAPAGTTYAVKDEFDSWTGTNPNEETVPETNLGTITLSGTNANDYIEETSSTGSAGTGHLHYENTINTTNPILGYTNALTNNQWYKIELSITQYVDAALVVDWLGGVTYRSLTFSQPNIPTGVYEWWFDAEDQEDIRIQSNGGSGDYVLDYFHVTEADTFFLLKEDFNRWEGNVNPNDIPISGFRQYTVQNETATNYVEETNSSGGAGTGHMHLVSDGGNININQATIIWDDTKTYAYEISVTGGSDVDLRIALIGGTTKNVIDITTTGTHTGTFTCNTGNHQVQIKRIAGTADTVVDYIYIWEDIP